MTAFTKELWQDKIAKEILDLPDDELMMLQIVTERVVQGLDKVEKLTDKEENLINVAIMMAYKEMKKIKAQLLKP